MDKYSFQYCPKFVLLSKDLKSVFLARRKGEQDYDGVYAFIGGKLERSDGGLVAGMKREKDEEVGTNCKVALYTDFSNTLFFDKKDGSKMVIPHFLGVHEGGEIRLNPEEYDDFQWVPLDKLAAFEPKISNIPEMVQKLIDLYENMPELKVEII